jgi:hypothetical protein
MTKDLREAYIATLRQRVYQARAILRCDQEQHASDCFVGRQAADIPSWEKLERGVLAPDKEGL